MLFASVVLSLQIAYAAAQVLINNTPTSVPSFVAPAANPFTTSSYFPPAAGYAQPKRAAVRGKVFDRINVIWGENMDYATAISNATFLEIAKQGILLDNYYALTHPSKANYGASVGGSIFGSGDDLVTHIPCNISTMVDLLEERHVTWGSYQESVPTNGYQGATYNSSNYHMHNLSSQYTYYYRKNNPFINYDSVATVPERAKQIRNFNDLAYDLNASSIPQVVWYTPNIVNNAHDTDINYMAGWIDFWLLPLLQSPSFNDPRSLTLLAFDEALTNTINNQVYAVLLGNAIPQQLRGTVDPTYYTHYSLLTTVQMNWELKSLGRGDANKTMSNVFGFVANQTGYQNFNVSPIPLTNLTRIYPGPLEPNLYVPFLAPDMYAMGAAGRGVYVSPCFNLGVNAATAPAPMNLTASPFAGLATANCTKCGLGDGFYFTESKDYGKNSWGPSSSCGGSW